MSRECSFCSKALIGALAPHVCEACGAPQPLRSGIGSIQESYFEALGAPKKFGQDLPALQRKFYELSRALHPDRFTLQGPDAQRNSLERMSFINQAYQTLKNPDSLRSYLLEQEGVPASSAKGQMPIELAESWFEIQDLLMENPEQAQVEIAKFTSELEQVTQSRAAKMQLLEREYDSDPSPVKLMEIARLIQERSYLSSLARDVERLKK